MGQNKSRVNRKKKRQRNQAILIASVLVIVGAFIAIKFIPKNKQENVQIANPSESKNGTSDNTESNNKDQVENNKDQIEGNKGESNDNDKDENNKLDNSGYLSFEEDPNADDAAMVAENTKGLLNGTKQYPVRTDGKKVVYLTFDDGPTKNAPKILDILNQYNVKGTFFVLGSSISNNANASEVLNRMVDEGHYIGMHTMSHDYKHLYGDNGPANFVAELQEEQKLISEITNGFDSQLCRAPYGTGGGTFTPAHITSLNQAGFKCWDWDVDSLDWKYADANKVIEDVKHDTELRKDATNLVVLFHEKNSTLEALPKVIEYYQSLGYEFLPYNPDQHFSRNFFHSDEI